MICSLMLILFRQNIQDSHGFKIVIDGHKFFAVKLQSLTSNSPFSKSKKPGNVTFPSFSLVETTYAPAGRFAVEFSAQLKLKKMRNAICDASFAPAGRFAVEFSAQLKLKKMRNAICDASFAPAGRFAVEFSAQLKLKKMRTRIELLTF